MASDLFGSLFGGISGLIYNSDEYAPWGVYEKYADQLSGLANTYNQMGSHAQTRAYIPEQQGATGLASVDPTTRAAQMKALSALGNEVDKKGLTAEDLAAQNQALEAAGRQNAGLRGAAQQNAAARGMGGAMSSYLGDLNSAQSSTNQANSNALNIAAQNRQRYMGALGQLGQQAGAVRGQDYQAASAQDSINQFNTQMRWNAQQGNNQLAQQQWKDQMSWQDAKNRYGQQAAQQGIDAWKANIARLKGLQQGFTQVGTGLSDVANMAMSAYGGGE
jgi:hypothetical protein